MRTRCLPRSRASPAAAPLQDPPTTPNPLPQKFPLWAARLIFQPGPIKERLNKIFFKFDLDYRGRISNTAIYQFCGIDCYNTRKLLT